MEGEKKKKKHFKVNIIKAPALCFLFLPVSAAAAHKSKVSGMVLEFAISQPPDGSVFSYLEEWVLPQFFNSSYLGIL